MFGRARASRAGRGRGLAEGGQGPEPAASGLTPCAVFTATSILRRQKQVRRKSVRFDQVTVYYFARRQGFTSVPSQGGSSLGMAQRHNSVRSYTLCEFAQEQEVNHREILREHLKEEKLHAKKMKVPVGRGVWGS